MAGIEIFALIVIFLLGAIGLVRGPAKELGVTMALVVLLAVFAQFDALVEFEQMPVKINNILGNFGLGSTDPLKQRVIVWFFYSAAVIVTAFLAYHGQETLAFQWKKPPTGTGAVILGWLAGALNGYLIFGTIWYYLDRLGYPIQRYAWFSATFTEFAQGFIKFLPQNISSGMILSGVALALLWWRILK
jgi:uncharacterized membrane protein required for colicin V production